MARKFKLPQPVTVVQNIKNLIGEHYVIFEIEGTRKRNSDHDYIALAKTGIGRLNRTPILFKYRETKTGWRFQVYFDCPDWDVSEIRKTMHANPAKYGYSRWNIREIKKKDYWWREYLSPATRKLAGLD